VPKTKDLSAQSLAIFLYQLWLGVMSTFRRKAAKVC